LLVFCKNYCQVLGLAIKRSAGTGSLVLQCYYALVRSHTDSANDDVNLDVEIQENPAGFCSLIEEEILVLNKNFQNHATAMRWPVELFLNTQDAVLFGYELIESGFQCVRDRYSKMNSLHLN